MPNVIPLTQLTPDDRFGIVVARWNETITRKLLDGAVATLRERGVADEAIDVAWVPGSFEIPLAAQRMADSGLYAAVLCLGAVIRGEKRTRAIPHRASNISRCGVSFGACGRTYTSIKPT